MQRRSHLAADAFRLAVEEIWDDYQRNGPGAVASERMGPLEESRAALQQTADENPQAFDDELREAVKDAWDLARRCVEHSQGLCFISGEAGLIPRKDMHDRMESSLRTLREFIRDNGG